MTPPSVSPSLSSTGSAASALLPSRDELVQLHAAHVAELVEQYDRVLAESGFGTVVLHSGSPKKRSDFDDQYWPLRPVPHFQHWLALNEADCALIVSSGRKPILARLRGTNFWETLPKTDIESYFAPFDVREIRTVEATKDLIADRTAAFVGEDTSRVALYGLDASRLNPPNLVGALDALRALKSPYEIRCLAEANRRAAVGHRAVLDAFRAGEGAELKLHLLYLGATEQDDPETPYKNIVATGANAATLHHVSYERASRGRGTESLLLDAGAACNGYCSDVTRTWVRGNDAVASAFAAMVSGVEQLQQTLCNAVRLEMPYESLHDESHRLVAKVLVNIGVVKGMTPEEAVEKKISRAFLPHGLGHSLGLQCHDVGCALLKPRADNPFLRNTSKIANGQVFTIEPGIYFIDSLLAPLREGSLSGNIDWKLVDALAALGGVRIEDDIVVGGPQTIRNLTREHLSVGGAAVS